MGNWKNSVTHLKSDDAYLKSPPWRRKIIVEICESLGQQ